MNIPTMDFQVLTSGHKVLEATRDALSIDTPQPLRYITMQTLKPATKLWPAINQPVNARLEQLGRSWAQQGQPQAAVEALAPFPGAENAQILRRIVNDPHYYQFSEARNGRLWVKTLQVQHLAWQVLTDWGMATARPKLRMPHDYYTSVSPWLFFLPPIAAVMIACLLMLLGRWAMLRRITLGLLVGALVLCVILWARSVSIVDELRYDTATTQWWVSSYRGWLQLTWFSSWRGDFEDWPSGARLVGMLPITPWRTDNPKLIAPTGLQYAHIPRAENEELWTRAPRTTEMIRLGVAVVSIEPAEDTTAMLHLRPPARFHRIEVHTGVIAALLLISWPSWRCVHALYRRRRLRVCKELGLCPACGYDLRATPQRCPECGNVTS
jgi:hypothetical protein